jgi:uncharacterized heparinase superfamily protein
MTVPLQRQMTGDESTFSFLNIRRRFDPGDFDWSSRDMGKLWRYNLHYFDYLQEENRSFQNKTFLIENWSNKVPKLAEDAWEPFPVSLRIVNWIKWFLSPETVGKIQKLWILSLYEQTLWLEKNIEYHLLANHLFKNGKAFLFAGLYFEGSDADRWLSKGIRIILKELEEQILQDGGHFERSPMYHSMILEDCLDMLSMLAGWEAGRLGGWGDRKSGRAEERKSRSRGQRSEVGGRQTEQGIPLKAAGLGRGTRDEESIYHLTEVLQAKAEKMASFLWGMCHPDGRIALFNDAAFGIEAEPEELFSYYERVTGKTMERDVLRIRSFPETGYFIMSPNPDDRLFIDCGAVGPDYQPGHSHCDTLSFELSLKGRRVVVDSGCCQYEDADIRQYNRGNAGHNTVTIGGKNQSEVWGAHRCARRARPLNPKLYADTDGALIFEGAHDGYKRLAGQPIHHRKISWQGDDIRIEDRIDGKGRHTVASHLHIHPDLTIEIKTGSALISAGDEPIATLSATDSGRINQREGWYCPEFGVRKSCKVLYLEHETTQLPLNFGWRFKLPK